MHWTIQEPFGRQWPPQVVWCEVPGIETLPAVVELAVESTDSKDDSTTIQARLPGMAALDSAPTASRPVNVIPAQVDGGRLAFVGDLAPGQTHRYRLLDESVQNHETVRVIEARYPGLVSTTADEATAAGLHLAWGASEPAAVLHGLRRADGTWAKVASQWVGCNVLARDVEVLADGPVVARLRQTFTLAGGATAQLTWEVDAASSAIRLDVAADRSLDAELVLHLDDVCSPDLAYWRPHSPTAWRGERGACHNRQIYHVPAADVDEIEIGPFYNWARDAAAFWSCWGEAGASLLYVGWVRPSLTHLPDGMRRLRLLAARAKTSSPASVSAPRSAATSTPPAPAPVSALGSGSSSPGGRVDLRIPIQRGRFRLALAVTDRPGTLPATDGPANCIDALHARLNGPGLDDLQRMDLEAVRAEERFPRLWLGEDDAQRVRQKMASWPWFRDRFAAHVDDEILNSTQRRDLNLISAPVLGQDPAGAYLATGDPARAAAALVQLTKTLDDIVEMLLDYGPSVDEALGISVARRWRALLISLDLVLGAEVVSPVQRAQILRQLAFIAEVQSTHDAWPANDSGIPRGNDNFHPNVISARGMAAALLDGHPRQHEWLAAAVQEMADFLERYHLPSGACRESATYQLACLGYAIQLHAAATRRGHDQLAKLPSFQRAFEFLAATQTPVDDRCGYRMLPTLGHVTVYAWCQTLQAYFAWAARATAGTDFSRRMMRAWQRGGGHVVSLHDYLQDNIWSQPLLLLDHTLTATEDDEDLAHSRIFDGLGAALRTRHADGSEGYVLAKMGESSGHFDQDEGSFLWYAWGQPILADFGTQYDPNHHAHPWLHNRISFDHKADGAPRDGRRVAGQLSEGVDYLCGEVVVRSQFFHGEWPDRDPDYDMRQAGDPWDLPEPQRWRRHLLYLHELEVIVLLDEIDSTLPTDWNLQVHADHVQTTDGKATFTGRFGVDLDVSVLQPAMPRLSVSGYSHLGFDEPRGARWWWRGARWTAAEGTKMTAMAEQALTLRAHAEAGTPYFAVLAARRRGQPQAAVEAQGDWGVRIVTGVGSATVSTATPFERWAVEIQTEAGTTSTVIDARQP